MCYWRFYINAIWDLNSDTIGAGAYECCVVIKSNDVAIAIVEKVAKGAITKLLVGALSCSIFERYLLIC